MITIINDDFWLKIIIKNHPHHHRRVHDGEWWEWQGGVTLWRFFISSIPTNLNVSQPPMMMIFYENYHPHMSHFGSLEVFFWHPRLLDGGPFANSGVLDFVLRSEFSFSDNFFRISFIQIWFRNYFGFLSQFFLFRIFSGFFSDFFPVVLTPADLR